MTPDTTGWLHVPGALANPACVYTVPNGATIHLNGDVTMNGQVLFHEPPCPTPLVFTRPVAPQNAGKTLTVDRLNMNPPFTSGWVEAWQTPATASACTGASGPTQYSELTTEFVVPQTPITESDNQLIYLFPGQSPSSLDQILQPVLQWGVICTSSQGCIGSFNSWTYAAWQVGPSNNVNHSNAIIPAVDDVLWGGSAFDEYSANGQLELWLIDGEDESNTGLGTAGIFAEASSSELWACAYAAVLESQGTINQSNCNDWPGGSSGVTFFTPPHVLDQNGNQVQPTFSSCIEPNSCIPSNNEYTGRYCGFNTSQPDGLFALFF